MSDIYVPLNVSNVQSKIPEGEDIIYSTWMKAVLLTFSGNVVKTTTFNTHVLMTNNGFAWALPRGPAGPELKYNTWLDVHSFKGGRIYFEILPKPKHSLAKIRDYFMLARGEKSETEAQFNQRKPQFPLKILPVAIDYKQKWIEQNQNTADKNQVKDQSKSLSTLQKEYSNFKKKAK